MGKQVGTNGFIGTFDKLSFYTMRGTEGVIVRKKGGPSAALVKKSPEFERTRENNEEFKIRMRMAAILCHSMVIMNTIKDKNIIGPLAARITKVQKTDGVNPRGQRDVRLGRMPEALEGFEFNNKNTVASIISGITGSIDQETATATVKIPAISNGVNLHLPKEFHYYRCIAGLIIIPDIVYGPNRPVVPPSYGKPLQLSTQTAWRVDKKRYDEEELVIEYEKLVPAFDHSVILLLGIKIGIPGENDVEAVKYWGAGCVQSVVSSQ